MQAQQLGCVHANPRRTIGQQNASLHAGTRSRMERGLYTRSGWEDWTSYPLQRGTCEYGACERRAEHTTHADLQMLASKYRASTL